MKLLYVINGMSAGGAQRSLLTICEELAKYPSNEIFVVTWLKEEDKYIVPTHINLINLTPLLCNNSKIDYFTTIFHLSKVIRNLRPNYVIAVQCNMYPRCFFASLFTGTKLIVWEHTSMSRKMDFEGRIARNFLYKFTNAVFVLTNKDLEYVRNRYKKTYVMPNPLPFPVNECKSTNRENIVTVIGRLDVWHIKGFDIMIQMWSQLVKYNNLWKLYIVGEGRHENVKYIENLIREYKVDDSVVLTGYIDDIQGLLSRTKIFALPSRIEGFPMGLIEAMSQGCACISFSVDGAVQDIINNGEDGLIVCDNDNKSFIEGLKELVSHPQRIEDMSKAAVKNIKRFHKSEIAKLWMEILQENNKGVE